MANTLTNVIPQLLAQGLGALRQNSITPRLVSHKIDEMAGRQGSTVDVPVSSAITIQTVAPGVTAPANQDIAPGTVPVALGEWKEAPFYLTDKEMLEVMDGIIPMQATEAIKSVANNVDGFILALGRKFFGYAGTAGTVPFTAGTTQDAQDLRVALNNQLAPMDDRHVVFDPAAEGEALGVRAFQDMSFSGDNAAIIEGQLNRRLGFTWWMNQNVPSHTTGTATGTPLTNGGEPLGEKTIATDGWTNDITGILLEGDIITFAGHTQTYVVTADADSGATTGPATVLIEPGLAVAVGDGVAITVKAGRVNNIAFQREAIAFATRPLEMHGSELGVISQSVPDPISGISLRLEVVHQHKQIRFSYDVLYGAEVIRRELGAILAG